jgi:hypothetical protein
LLSSQKPEAILWRIFLESGVSRGDYWKYFGFNVSIQPLAVEVASENFSAISSERIGPNLYFPPFMENDCGDSGKAEGFAYGLGLRF